jgi:hypothetical protein
LKDTSDLVNKDLGFENAYQLVRKAATHFSHASLSVGTPHDWLLSPLQCQGPAIDGVHD